MTNTMSRTYTHAPKRRMPTEQERAAIRRKKRIRQRNFAKLVIIMLPIIGMIAGIFIGAKANSYAQSVKLNDYGRHIAYVSYTVKGGDTIWGIAQDLAALNPEYNDIRQYISDIERVNKLSGDDLKAGQTILIPYYISPSGVTDYSDIYDKYGIGR